MAAAGIDRGARHRSVACCLVLWVAVAVADQVALTFQPTTPSARSSIRAIVDERCSRWRPACMWAWVQHGCRERCDAGSASHRYRCSDGTLRCVGRRGATLSISAITWPAGQQLVQFLSEPVHVTVTESSHCALFGQPRLNAAWSQTMHSPRSLGSCSICGTLCCSHTPHLRL